MTLVDKLYEAASSMWTASGEDKIRQLLREAATAINDRDIVIEQQRKNSHNQALRIIEQNRALEETAEQLHRRNLELDALYYVWCDGGCTHGVNRHSHPPLTAEVVAAAEYNTIRLLRWFVNNSAKDADPTVEARRPIWNTTNDTISDLVEYLRTKPNHDAIVKQAQDKISQLEATLTAKNTEIAAITASLAEAKSSIAEFEWSFAMYDKACQRGTDMWREGHPDRELQAPDTAKLVAWLIERLDIASSTLSKLHAILEEAK